MRRTPLRSRSKKRETVMRKRRPFVAEFLADNPWCIRCGGVADTVHEPLTRARGGSILDPKNALPACTVCNDWFQDNPVESEANGWLVWSWDASA